MSDSRNNDWQRSIALAFTGGGLCGYLIRSIRPIAILTSMITGSALGSLATYEYFDNEQKHLPYQKLPQINNFQIKKQHQNEYFSK